MPLAPSQERDFVEIIDPDAEAARTARRWLATAGIAARCWGSPESYLDAVLHRTPSAFIVEVRQPGRSGLAFLHAVRERGEDAAFVFVSCVRDVAVAVAAMKAGASDFLPKPVARHRLIDAVQEALRRRSVEAGRRAATAACRRRVGSLTPRERQVLEGVIAGRSNRVIAGGLGLSEKTVEEYRARMMTRLGASSVADAVKIGLAAGLWVPGTEPHRAVSSDRLDFAPEAFIPEDLAAKVPEAESARPSASFATRRARGNWLAHSDEA